MAKEIDADSTASWGGFQIWVGGQEPLLASGTRASVSIFAHWYLLPLLEWFAAQWNPLLHEERLPARNAADTAWASLRATRFPPPAVEMDDQRVQVWEHDWQQWWKTGTRYEPPRKAGSSPDVVFRRCRDVIEVSWGRTPSSGMPSHFVFDGAAPGSAHLEPRQVAESLYDILSSAGEYLALGCSALGFGSMH